VARIIGAAAPSPSRDRTRHRARLIPHDPADLITAIVTEERVWRQGRA
jgi:hypothetical protein